MDLFIQPRNQIKSQQKMKEDKIQIGHGSGGKLTSELVKKFFVKNFNNQILDQLTDSAILDIDNHTLAFTTDSYVVDPIFFPGGDIGKLAVCGTVNDLSVSGAVPVFMSGAFIIEEDSILMISGKFQNRWQKKPEKQVLKSSQGIPRL